MFDFLFGPRIETVTRTPEAQAEADERAARLALYHYDSCPYCAYVRRAIKKLSLPIQLRNIHKDPRHLEALVAGGGRRTVPCLRIEQEDGEVEWMYESEHIKDYLVEQFGGVNDVR